MEALPGVIFEVLSLLFAALHALMRQHCLSPNPGVTEQIYELRNEMYAYITRMAENHSCKVHPAIGAATTFPMTILLPLCCHSPLPTPLPSCKKGHP